jgi:hypothetical protein
MTILTAASINNAAQTVGRSELRQFYVKLIFGY